MKETAAAVSFFWSSIDFFYRAAQIIKYPDLKRLLLRTQTLFFLNIISRENNNRIVARTLNRAHVIVYNPTVSMTTVNKRHEKVTRTHERYYIIQVQKTDTTPVTCPPVLGFKAH